MYLGVFFLLAPSLARGTMYVKTYQTELVPACSFASFSFSFFGNLYLHLEGKSGTAKGEGLVWPYHFYCWDLFSRLQMAHKCKINGTTLTLRFVCLSQIFLPYHYKMLSAVPVNGKHLCSPTQGCTGT